MMNGPAPTAAQWLERLESGAGGHGGLAAIYGSDDELLRERRGLARRVLLRHLERFGDGPVRIFRSPGRINLRGMHVDTHGGWLNLMTHQRETVVVACPAPDNTCTFVNLEPEYPEVSFNLDEEARGLFGGGGWASFIALPDVIARVQRRRAVPGMDWANYLAGSCLRVGAECAVPRGMRAAVGSDLPRGAALSSSAALCVAVQQAFAGINGVVLDDKTRILAEQDAEWYAGARVGMSDQGAMVLGRLGKTLNIALFAEDFRLDNATYHDFPGDAAVLVVNSHTKRSLSGAHLVDYTRNRFAYSVAMHVLRCELAALGHAPETVARLDRLSRITPDSLGGAKPLYALLRRIPEELTLDEMRARYNPPGLDAAYDRYFGGVPEGQRPVHIRLRGPLVFGIAESERARLFAAAADRADLAALGAMMTTGHNGDRRVDRDGYPYICDVSDRALEMMEQQSLPVEECPGAYGASSPVLDWVVDCALGAGALGACLTGAGIAGAVLALCRREDADRVAEEMRRHLASENYLRVTNREKGLCPEELALSVVVNRPTAGAGELPAG